MFERFKRNEGPERTSGGVTTAERPADDDADWPAGHTRTLRDGTVADDDATVADRDRTMVDDRSAADGTAAPVGTRTTTSTGGIVGGSEAMRRMRARQRERFGGFNWGAAFFGWLVAVGLAALLVGLLAGAGAAVGLTKTSQINQNTEEITLGGGIALLVALLIAYYSGGYVAGRMSRFDGARQGAGVWIFGLIVTIALAVVAVAAGSDYNVLERLNLPRLPTGDDTFTTGGVIALVAIVIGTLVAAAAGGKLGERYHRRVDRAGFIA